MLSNTPYEGKKGLNLKVCSGETLISNLPLANLSWHCKLPPIPTGKKPGTILCMPFTSRPTPINECGQPSRRWNWKWNLESRSFAVHLPYSILSKTVTWSSRLLFYYWNGIFPSLIKLCTSNKGLLTELCNNLSHATNYFPFFFPLKITSLEKERKKKRKKQEKQHEL